MQTPACLLKTQKKRKLCPGNEKDPSGVGESDNEFMSRLNDKLKKK